MSVKLLKMYDESMIQNFSSLVKINNRDLLSDWRACSLDILMVRVNLMNRARGQSRSERIRSSGVSDRCRVFYMCIRANLTEG